MLLFLRCYCCFWLLRGPQHSWWNSQKAGLLSFHLVVICALCVASELDLITCVILQSARGSLLRLHPRYLWLVRLLAAKHMPVFDLGITLGSFNALTKKPLKLSSNNKCFLESLWARRPCRFMGNSKHALVKKTVRNGKTQVTGIRSALRESQPGTWNSVRHHYIYTFLHVLQLRQSLQIHFSDL